MDNKPILRICYFGNFFPEFSRNRIYQKGLRIQGANIVECRDQSPGLKKFWRLWRKHRQIKNDYDVMIVGYPGQIVTPFAKLLSRKKVVLDALCSLYEGEIISRQSSARFSLNAWRIWLIDYLAYLFADLVLVETEEQKNFFAKKFFVRAEKMKVMYTGADDAIFHPDAMVEKRSDFTAVFRGRFLPEAGVDVIVRAAKILEEKNVKILIIGGGLLEKEIRFLINKLLPKNLVVEDKYLTYDQIRDLMLSCHVSLGQFADHERLSRTIPHKAFETLALGLPYVTAQAAGVCEIIDEKKCIMVTPGDATELAHKLIELKDNLIVRQNIADSGYELYCSRFTPRALGKILYQEAFLLAFRRDIQTDQPLPQANKAA